MIESVLAKQDNAPKENFVMSNSEFRSAFDRLVSTTNEYEELLPLLERSILPKLNETSSLLDVGAGPGLITLPLSKHFEHIGIVEPDPVYCLAAAKKLVTTGKPVTVLNGSWESAKLERQTFDLIICAHVLYFVAPEHWDDFIQKMLRYLAPGGTIAVVLVSRKDETIELIRGALGIQEPGSYPFSAAVIEKLQTWNYKYAVHSFEAAITTDTAEELHNVMALFPIMQYDTSSTQEERLALIRQHFNTGETYQLPYVVDVVTVKASLTDGG